MHLGLLKGNQKTKFGVHRKVGAARIFESK
jgi:hypothetical protein